MSEAATPWHTARATAHACEAPVTEEFIPLHGAGGRLTSRPVAALTALPVSPISAMDGWAVAGEGPWSLIGESLAGHAWSGTLTTGSAIAVATGSSIPDGATAVLRSENAVFDSEGRLANTGQSILPGKHIRPAGEECGVGDVLINAGTFVTPVHLGLAAAAGHDGMWVVRRPRARVLVLGDELLRSGVPSDGKVRDSLGPQLIAWLEAWGCEVLGTMWVADTADDLLASLQDCSDADLILTTGGTAAGPVDLLHSCLAQLGSRLVIDGVDCRPGHPMMLAETGGTWLVGLPGNPLAAIAALMTLAHPLLSALQGLPLPDLTQVELEGNVGARGAGTRLMPCTLAGGRARPCEYVGSGMLRGIAGADGFAVVEGEGRAGDVARWLPFPWSRA